MSDAADRGGPAAGGADRSGGTTVGSAAGERPSGAAAADTAAPAVGSARVPIRGRVAPRREARGDDNTSGLAGIDQGSAAVGPAVASVSGTAASGTPRRPADGAGGDPLADTVLLAGGVPDTGELAALDFRAGTSPSPAYPATGSAPPASHPATSIDPAAPDDGYGVNAALSADPAFPGGSESGDGPVSAAGSASGNDGALRSDAAVSRFPAFPGGSESGNSASTFGAAAARYALPPAPDATASGGDTSTADVRASADDPRAVGTGSPTGTTFPVEVLSPSADPGARHTEETTDSARWSLRAGPRSPGAEPRDSASGWTPAGSGEPSNPGAGQGRAVTYPTGRTYTSRHVTSAEIGNDYIEGSFTYVDHPYDGDAGSATAASGDGPVDGGLLSYAPANAASGTHYVAGGRRGKEGNRAAEPSHRRLNRAPAAAGEPATTPALRRGNQAVLHVIPAQRTPHSGRPVGNRVPPACWSGRPRLPARLRSRLIIAGLVLIVVLGGSLLGVHLIGRDDSAPRMVQTPAASPSQASPVTPLSPRTAGFSPIVCDVPPPDDVPVAPRDRAARGVNGWALQAGWSYFTDGSGFHIPVPDGWTYQRIGATYCFREPGGPRVLSLDVGRQARTDPLRGCRAEERRLRQTGRVRDYALIAIAPVTLLHKAADWEYRYRGDTGILRRATTRWFSAGGRAYALGWSTTEATWAAEFSKIQMIRSTFYTDGPTASATRSKNR